MTDLPGISNFRADRPLRPARPNAPAIWYGTWRGQRALLKCYHHCATLYRQTVGRLAMSREWWALNRMSTSGRAPRPFERPRPWTVVMEWLDGDPLETIPRGKVPALVLASEAEALLACMAKAGVVHGDLGHDCWSAQGRESNLLVTEAGRLMAIDFAGCWRADWPGVGPLMRAHDELLLTKVLYHFGDETLAGHPGWRLPSKRPLAWWDLMALMGKL